MNDSEGSALYLIEILHQTTTASTVLLASRGCILSKFYIKPQQRTLQHDSFCVVSYRNSTSNHNSGGVPVAPGGVVSYRNSTSNHNQLYTLMAQTRLYLIEILHQTTTIAGTYCGVLPLYLIEILHQTTTTFSTIRFVLPLYLIEILHQTTTFC